jgi:hypothetical protein
MPISRTRACEKVIIKFLKKHKTATGPELNKALRKKGLEPSTFARWNLRSTGKIKIVRRGHRGPGKPNIYALIKRASK